MLDRKKLTENVPNFPSFYWRLNSSNQLVACNSVWESKIAQFQKDDVENCSWLDFVHTEEKFDLLDAISSSNYLKKHFSFEFRLKDLSNNWIWVHGHFQPLFNTSGQSNGFDVFGIEFDIQSQSRKSIFSRLITAENASNVKSGFLANMSHEIRAPIQSIVGYAHMLADLELSSDERKKMSRAMARSGDFLLQLVKDILDFSKIEAGRMDLEILPCSPWYTIAEVFETLALEANKKNLKLVAVPEGNIPVIFHTDLTRLRQVLVNLISNAIKFTTKGEIKVRIKIQNTSEIVGECLAFFVEDQGPGMDQKQIESLFKPFVRVGKGFSSRIEGTGLGLTIANRLTSLLGGVIKVSTKFKFGSCFTLYLPIDTNDLKKLVGSEKLGTLNSRDLNTITSTLALPSSASILLAEDCEDIQVYLRYLLEKEGMNVSAVSSGKQVLEALAQSDFDLILMDLQMPDGDGKETTIKIRDSGNKIPIFAFTANATSEDEKECIESGFDLFLTKPIDREKLLEALACYLPIAESGKFNNPLVKVESLDDSSSDLQNQFLKSLDLKMLSIKELFENKSMELLSKEIHQLRGAGGFFGFPLLTQISEKIEYAVKNESNEQLIQHLIKELENSVNKIISK